MSKRRRWRVATDKRLKNKQYGGAGGKADRPDHGPAERWQHSHKTMIPTEQSGRMAARAENACVLDMLLAQALIDDQQHEAGLKLKGDAFLARVEPRQIMNYAPQLSSNGVSLAEISAVREAAHARFVRAVRIVGICASDAVVTVCCLNQLPRRIHDLQTGLTRLAAYYAGRLRPHMSPDAPINY